MSGALSVVFGLLSQAPALPADGGVPLAVLPLRSEGLQLNEVVRIDGLLRAAGTDAGFRVQSPDETTALLEAAQTLGVDCDLGQPSCGARIGGAVAVDRVIVGHAALVEPFAGSPGGVGVEATLVDASSGASLRHVTALLPREPDAQVAAFAAVAQALFRSAQATPWLIVNGSPPGSVVRVDGVAVGALPLGRPIAGAIPGVHVVEVRAAGHLPWTAAVTTTTSEPTLIDVALVVDPNAQREVVSPLQRTLVWGMAATGGVLAVVGGVASAAFGQPWFVLDQAKRDLAALSPSDADYPVEAARLATAANDAHLAWNGGAAQATVASVVVASVGVVAGVAGVVWGLLLPDADEPAPPAPNG